MRGWYDKCAYSESSEVIIVDCAFWHFSGIYEGSDVYLTQDMYVDDRNK